MRGIKVLAAAGAIIVMMAPAASFADVNNDRIFVTHTQTDSIEKNGSIKLGWYTRFADPGNTPKVVGTRSAYQKGDALFVKDGGDSGQWQQVANQVSVWDISANRVAIVYTNGQLWVKQGALTNPFVEVGTNACDTYVSDNRLAMLQNGSSDNCETLSVKEGTLNASWVAERTSTGSAYAPTVALTDTVIAYSDSDGNLFVKNGLYDQWTAEYASEGAFYGVKAVGSRLCMAAYINNQPYASNGILCKDGSLTAPWVTVAYAINDQNLYFPCACGIHDTGTWDIGTNRVAAVTWLGGVVGNNPMTVWGLEGSLTNNSGWLKLDDSDTVPEVAIQK